MRNGILFLFLLFAFSSAFANLCVSAPKATLREAPHKDSKITWVVGRYMPLKEISRAKGWVQVSDIDGKQHWVSSTQVQRAAPGARCLAVKSDYVMVRAGPGRGFEPTDLGLVDKYTPLRDQGGEDGWTKVQNDSGQQGWLPLSSTWKPVDIVRLNY